MNDWTDRAGRDYWERNWSEREAPEAIDPKDARLDNHMWRRLDQFMRPFLERGQAKGGGEVVEVGCGSSRWLPYFDREYGLRVAGVDYSERGCAQAQATLQKSHVSGEIHQVDVFALPGSLLGRFTIVFSFGLVEHFAPTERIIEQLAKLGRSGGEVITIIPNMTHSVGWLQKMVNSGIYEIHVPLDVGELAVAHERCGLRVEAACYVGTVNWSVINFGRRAKRIWCPAATRLAAWATKVVWVAERLGVPELPNRWTSPYIACVATIP